jgi:hypothetical protein
VARFVFSARLAAAALATVLSSSVTAEGYVVKKAASGELVHWEPRDVGYSIDPAIDANVPYGAEAARLATEGWSGAVGAPDMHVHAADATSPTKPGFDGKNGVFFMAGGYEPAGRALAITVLTYDNASGKILDADVIVNGAYTFQVLGAPAPNVHVAAGDIGPRNTDAVAHDEVNASPDEVYDLYHVVAHEFGHSLGMNDELEKSTSLMYRYTTPNDPSMREPASDDIQGLAEIYATKLDAHGNGCGGATVSPKKPASGASSAATIAALGLLVFLVVRARSDRRARFAFVVAAAAAALTLLPRGPNGAGVARASGAAPGAARARVLDAQSSFEDGLVKTTYTLATTTCHTGACPDVARGVAWGGTVGGVRQDVGGQYAPKPGDDVDVSFRAVKAGALAALERPLAGAGGSAARAMGEVRVLTLAP